MAVIGLVVHEFNDQAEDQARDLATWLDAGGHVLRIPDTQTELQDLGAATDAKPGPGLARFADGMDLMVSLGGDGSMLKAIDLVSDHAVPVLGVNFGRMGYLTEVEPDGLQSAVERFLAGEYHIEERMRLSTSVQRRDGSLEPLGNSLNETIVEKKVSGRTVRLQVTIDHRPFTEYVADGVIIATPTGSTAYSLSARGPIVAPTHEALIVTAVAPHMLFDRSLVLAPESEVRIEVVADRVASVALDGRDCGDLLPGDAVVCTRSAVPARFVVGDERDFLGVLKDKFGLRD